MKTITLAHGNGGQAMQQLIGELFIRAFDNPLPFSEPLPRIC